MIVNMKEQRIINLNHLNILEIVGKGASELLQGQLTCDLEKVKNRSFELGAICNTKGRVINSFILCKAPSKELDS
jgi:folate-binding Fe-S cluster repair protein YgfZ